MTCSCENPIWLRLHRVARTRSATVAIATEGTIYALRFQNSALECSRLMFSGIGCWHWIANSPASTLVSRQRNGFAFMLGDQPRKNHPMGYRKFVEPIVEASGPRGSKPRMVLAAIVRMPETFALVDLERACRGVSRDMIRRVLDSQKGEAVDCIGRGPGALWQRRGN